MAVPKRRTSSGVRNMRRSHHKLPTPEKSVCTNCKEPKLPHRICTNCGFYKGKAIIVDEIDTEIEIDSKNTD